MASPAAMQLLPYQQRLFDNEARFTWNNWSRQTGKSTAAVLRRILRGMRRRRNQIFLSAGERQSRELMMKARQFVDAMKIASEFRELTLFEGTTFKQLEIAIPSVGIRIIGLPANPMTARGFTGDVLLDEFAMHKDDGGIYAAVFPSVLRGAGEMDICSTPNGRQNMFYRLKSNELFSHDTVTIYDAVSQGLDEDPEIMKAGCDSDERWRQEFLCEFVDEATAFLTYEMIAECEDSQSPRELDIAGLRRHKGDVVVGVDIGRKHDLTVLWAFAVEDRTLVSLGLLELASTTFREQFEVLCEVLSCRCLRRCCIDATGLGMQMAEQAVEQFGNHRVEGCNFSATFKAQIAAALRIKFTDRLIRIPVCNEIRNDLHSIRKTVTTAGNIRLDAPRTQSSHADRFWAGALAVHAAGDAILGPIECEVGGETAHSYARPTVAASVASGRNLSGVFGVPTDYQESDLD